MPVQMKGTSILQCHLLQQKEGKRGRTVIEGDGEERDQEDMCEKEHVLQYMSV